MLEIRRTDEFSEWLRALRDTSARRRIEVRITRLSLGNAGDVKPIGDSVSELRMTFGPGYRIYFVQRGGAFVILLCGGDKGSQARDIERAKILAKEV